MHMICDYSHQSDNWSFTARSNFNVDEEVRGLVVTWLVPSPLLANAPLGPAAKLWCRSVFAVFVSEMVLVLRLETVVCGIVWVITTWPIESKLNSKLSMTQNKQIQQIDKSLNETVHFKNFLCKNIIVSWRICCNKWNETSDLWIEKLKAFEMWLWRLVKNSWKDW